MFIGVLLGELVSARMARSARVANPESLGVKL
jgi:hypothetical protein